MFPRDLRPSEKGVQLVALQEVRNELPIHEASSVQMPL